jgi:hypothetical protein
VWHNDQNVASAILCEQSVTTQKNEHFRSWFSASRSVRNAISPSLRLFVPFQLIAAAT